MHVKLTEKLYVIDINICILTGRDSQNVPFVKYILTIGDIYGTLAKT